jgi:hypothetical protein
MHKSVCTRVFIYVYVEERRWKAIKYSSLARNFLKYE